MSVPVTKENVENARYIARLKKLNNHCEEKTVWDSIDRPLKPLIYELHRLGLQTKFSCCGFSYEPKEGEEPKSHSTKKCYVMLHTPNNPSTMQSFIRITAIAKQLGWRVHMAFPNVWEIYINNSMLGFYEECDHLEESIHDYETYAICIFELVKQLHALDTVSKDVVIQDGNRTYGLVDEWQIKPKLSCKIEFDSTTDEYTITSLSTQQLKDFYNKEND
jgi:hypothetical protein